MKALWKKEQGQYKPKNPFEALVINQLMSINNRLDGLEARMNKLEARMDNLEISINQMKNAPTTKKN